MSSTLSSLFFSSASSTASRDEEEDGMQYTSFPVFGSVASTPQPPPIPQTIGVSSSSSVPSSVPLYFNVEGGEAIMALPVMAVPEELSDEPSEESFEFSSSDSDAEGWGDEMALFGGMEGDNARQGRGRSGRRKRGKRWVMGVGGLSPVIHHRVFTCCIYLR